MTSRDEFDPKSIIPILSTRYTTFYVLLINYTIQFLVCIDVFEKFFVFFTSFFYRFPIFYCKIMIFALQLGILFGTGMARRYAVYVFARGKARFLFKHLAEIKRIAKADQKSNIFYAGKTAFH